MAKTTTTINKPTVNPNTNHNTVTKVNNTDPAVKYALSITCICGGRYLPITHNIGDTKSSRFRCTKCGKDINVELTPVNVNNAR